MLSKNRQDGSPRGGEITLDDLGSRLRYLRNQAGFSLYEVEKRLRHQGSDLHFTSISKYERGDRQPSLAVLRELARVYDVSLAQVVTGAEDVLSHLPPDLVRSLSLLQGRPDLLELVEAARPLAQDQVKSLVDMIRKLSLSG